MIENLFEPENGLITLPELKSVNEIGSAARKLRDIVNLRSRESFIRFREQGIDDPTPVQTEVLVGLTKSGTPKHVTDPDQAVFAIAITVDRYGYTSDICFELVDYQVKQQLGLVLSSRITQISESDPAKARLPKEFQSINPYNGWSKSKAYDLGKAINRAIPQLVAQRKARGLS